MATATAPTARTRTPVPPPVSILTPLLLYHVWGRKGEGAGVAFQLTPALKAAEELLFQPPAVSSEDGSGSPASC